MLVVLLSFAMGNCAFQILAQNAPAKAQAPGLVSPSSPSTQLPPGCHFKHPADWTIRASDEELRYLHLFGLLRAWDEFAAKADANGDSGWADHWRTMLERESAITPEEAANVRQIVTQYFKDEEARSARVQEIRSQAIASGGDSCQAVFSDPDYMALHKQQWGLIDQSIAQLVSALGARSFSRLDLYTRHMNDRSNATQSSHQTPGSEQQSGVGK